MSSSRWPSPASALAAVALALLGSGCDDNIVCVFFTGCATTLDPDGSLATAGNAAILPVDGQWIELGRPTVTSVAPSATGDAAATTTPIVLTFSESMNAASLADAIEIVAAGFATGPPVRPAQALVGDGRMLILLPATPFLPGDYTIEIVEGSAILDLTGQVLQAVDPILGSFTVAQGPDEPILVASWPLDGLRNQSQTSKMAVVFDRPLDAATVDTASIALTVDGDAPAFDPEPAFVTPTGEAGPDGRALTFQSVDADARPVRLGTDAVVTITLSAAGAPLADSMGAEVPTTTISFDTAPFAAPLTATFLSPPPDAIGLTNLTFGNADQLTVQVELADGEPGDLVDVILFGLERGVEEPNVPQMAAFLRSVQLEDTAPVLSATFDLVDLNFLSGTTPDTARIADGPVAFSFRVRRIGVSTPLTVLDVDPLLPGIQDPVLDTIPPVLEEFLLPAGSTDVARSDQRDLVITGRASERVVAVDVTSDAGDNAIGGMLPEVIGSSPEGLFIARPVKDPDGIIEGNVAFTAIAYDAARNASAPVSATFRQLGVVGPGSHTPGDDILVEVFDSQTLELLQGATVITHADMGGPTDYPHEADAVTQANGRVTVATPGAPSIGTILTVDMPGYDLFTYHGVSASRFSVPLTASGVSANASVNGGVIDASEPARVAFEFGLVDLVLSDSRRPEEATPTYALENCNAVGNDCNYGPEPIRTARLGAQTFLAGRLMLDEMNYSATEALQAFDLTIPVLPTPAGMASETFVDVPFLFSEPGVPNSEQPVELPTLQMVGAFTLGIDSDDLIGDPFVTVESIIPGVPGAVTVGLGFAFPQVTPGLWIVRAAFAGAVSDVGFFGAAGTIDSDPFLRAEMRDSAGNRAGHRPRRSAIGTLPGGILIPGNVPVLFTPPEGGGSGGSSYGLVIDNSIIDAQAVTGLYRVTLGDEAGRGWTLWTEDRDDATGLTRVAVPDLTPAGSVGLADGEISIQMSTFAWAGLDTSSFLWSDVEREHSVYSHSAPLTFSQP